MGTHRTTRCCSAVALIATTSLTLAAQDPKPIDETAALFPIRPVWTLGLNNRLTAVPLYSGLHAYFPIEGDRLAAYGLDEHGRQEWVVSASPLMEPTAAEGLIVLVEPDVLKTIHASTGDLAWQEPGIGELAVPPASDGGWLIVATGAGEVIAFGAADGNRVWQRNLGMRAHAPAALSANRVYVPLKDGRIVAMQLDTGDLLWERRLGGPASGLLEVADRLYAGSNDNFFYALDSASGRVAWRWRTGADVVGVPVVDERNVYFVSLDNVLRALSRKSGVQQWVRLLPLRPTRGPLKVDRTLIVSGVAPTLRAYNMKDGTPAGELPAEGEVAGAPYAMTNPATGLPQVLVVTRDIAKGATATLFTRQLEAPLSPNPPSPDIFKPVALEP